VPGEFRAQNYFLKTIFDYSPMIWEDLGRNVLPPRRKRKTARDLPPPASTYGGNYAACAVAGVQPYRMRRYLDRPSVIAHLRAEHRKFREVVVCGNTAALRRVRDTSPNGMAIVASCRALDGSQAEDAGRADVPSPGVTIRIISERQPIDVTPAPTRIIDADAD